MSDGVRERVAKWLRALAYESHGENPPSPWDGALKRAWRMKADRVLDVAGYDGKELALRRAYDCLRWIYDNAPSTNGEMIRRLRATLDDIQPALDDTESMTDHRERSQHR